MGEIATYLKEKYLKTNKEAISSMNKQRVKNTILYVCDKYLRDADDVLTFEVIGTDIQYIAMVVVEDPIRTKYRIDQISDSLFTAQLREFDI